jgi:hypothetical protein
MKKIYALATPAYHEMDEMVFKYAVYEEEQLVKDFTLYHEYRKPALCGLYSIILLLKEIPQYKEEPVQVIVNDGALIEQINGTTTTKNNDILKVAELCRKHLYKYGNQLKVVSVAGNHDEKNAWEKHLEV